MIGDQVTSVGREGTPAPGRGELVGREAELDRLRAFIDDPSALPAALVIEGPAGAGKTTLWRAAVERAHDEGYRVLACRPAGAEIQLAHAGLSDLLEPHIGLILDGLPPPQRRALEVALLIRPDDGSPPDRRAIAAGFLGGLRALSREGAVLLAVDDAQWLDDASAEVLEYAVRRLQGEPVAVLISRRTGSATVRVEGAGGRSRLEQALERSPTTLEVGPLSLGALHRLLRTRTNLEFNRRTLQRIHETSGGNPFYALELARAMERDDATERLSTGAEPLPLSASLEQLLVERLGRLPEPTRSALFVAAALSQPRLDLIARATGVDPDEARAALRPAQQASIVRTSAGPDGAIEFAHPLFAAAAYAAVDPADRRSWHARIAGAATDAETRARHLAMARPGPSAEVAAELAAAARVARQRGATGAAAELFGAALDRLPRAADADADAAIERATLVAEAAPTIATTGQPDLARRLLQDSIGAIAAGPLRAELLLHLANLVGNDPGGGDLEFRLVEQALAEADDDMRRTAAALLDREQWERSRDRLGDALPIARRALEAAEAAGDERLVAEAHVRTADLETVLGVGGDPIQRFERALELAQRHRVDAQNSAQSMLAVCLIRRGRVDEARPFLIPERARATAEGDEASQSWVCMYLAELEWLAGRWDEAAAYAAEGEEVAERAGLRMRLGPLRGLVALLEASRGDADRARTLGTDAIAILEEVDELAYGNYARGMMGFLELSLGDAAAAHELLQTYGVERGIEGSKRLSFIGDEIEALVRLGDIGGAASLADELVRRGETLSRPTLLATAARCRALILGSRGDLEGAVASAQEAIASFDRLGLPFEHARALLVLGEIQRRAKQRRAARASLTRAIEAFDRLGAHLWSAKANAERARVGGRSTIEGLSETEARVAALVAAGKSNKEVAAELFVTVRAVEANLSKVYAKLGIRSRTELARRI